jgi:hypothetical protein
MVVAAKEHEEIERRRLIVVFISPAEHIWRGENII